MTHKLPKSFNSLLSSGIKSYEPNKIFVYLTFDPKVSFTKATFVAQQYVCTGLNEAFHCLADVAWRQVLVAVARRQVGDSWT